jgi:glutathione synthase/RimK-type ligase-like ATP-grasp enzyme
MAPVPSVQGDEHHPLRVALFYTEGQSLGGVDNDHEIILESLRGAGLEVEMLDLMHVSRAPDGTFLLHDVHTGIVSPWDVPHAALMYHGAIGPVDTVELLEALEAAGCVVVNGSTAWPVFTDKHLFAEYMSARDVRVIPTVSVTTVDELRAAFDAIAGPVIVKKAVSTEGDDIFVVRTAQDLDRVAAWMPRLGGELIVQPIVDARIHDDLEPSVHAQLEATELDRRHEFRVHTARFADGTVRVDATYMRVAPDATQIVNNVAQGARPISVEFGKLHPADQRTVLDAAESSPAGGDIIGWDLIGQPGDRRIIEGNSGSGLTTDVEGLDARDLVRSYATIVRAAAESSLITH